MKRPPFLQDVLSWAILCAQRIAQVTVVLAFERAFVLHMSIQLHMNYSSVTPPVTAPAVSGPGWSDEPRGASNA